MQKSKKKKGHKSSIRKFKIYKGQKSPNTKELEKSACKNESKCQNTAVLWSSFKYLLTDSHDQRKILFKFALLYLNFLGYKGVNEKLLLSLSFVLSETELSKLSAILDLSDLSELSAKHELAISKSMLINKFILVILRSPKCN